MGNYEELREQAAKEGYEEGNRRMDEIAAKVKAEYSAKLNAQRAARKQTVSNSAVRRLSEDRNPLSAYADESSAATLARFQPRKEKRDSIRTTDRGNPSTAEDDSFASGNLFAAPNATPDMPENAGQAMNSIRTDATSMNDPVARSGQTVLTGRSKERGMSSDMQPDRIDNASTSGNMPSAPHAPIAGSSIPTKRSSISNPSGEQPRLGTTSFKIPKKESAHSVRSSNTPQSEQLRSIGTERPPLWYDHTSRPATRNKKDAGVDVLLRALSNEISNCHKSLRANDKQQASKDFDKLRDRLHKVVFEEVSPALLKMHKLLHNDVGLRSVFDPDFNDRLNWPFDIKADAEELYNKWARKVFETDILRGIRFKKDGTGKNTASIVPEAKVDAKYFGNGDLLNGQWWPFQMCTLRDGAHGSTQGGIFGSVEEGAYSCIIAGGKNDAGEKYPNEDFGDEVRYCGTDSTDGKPTTNTSIMLASVNKEPVRLIRSAKLGGKFAPSVGFRYDGLYDVVGFKNVDGVASKRQRHIFTLIRRQDQDPIRGGNGPEKRPTIQEESEFEKAKKFGGILEG